MEPWIVAIIAWAVSSAWLVSMGIRTMILAYNAPLPITAQDFDQLFNGEVMRQHRAATTRNPIDALHLQQVMVLSRLQQGRIGALGRLPGVKDPYSKSRISFSAGVA